MLRLTAQLAQEGVDITFAYPKDLISWLMSAGGITHISLEWQNLPFCFLPPRMLEGEDRNGYLAFEPSRYENTFRPIREKMLPDKNASIVEHPTNILSKLFFRWAHSGKHSNFASS